MKRILLLSVFVIVSLFANAQFIGGFYEGDPDAWIDKEPFFACQNNYVYNGWVQNLYNVTIVVNNENVYSSSSVWQYGQYIFLGKENGFEFSSGDIVAVYVGNQCIGSWKYSKASIISGLAGLKLKGSGKLLKSVWKYVKKIR